MDISKITQTIDELLNYIAQKLEVPVQMAQEILYKEYTYKMLINGIWCFLGMCIFIFGIVLLHKTIENKWWSEDEYDIGVGYHIFMFCVIFCTCIPIIVGCGNAIIHGLVSPEIYMWKKIIQPMLQ
jgi:hypothetical protein